MAPKQRSGGSKSPHSHRTPSPHSPNLAAASTPPGSTGRFPTFPVPELTFRNTIRNADLESAAWRPEGFSYDKAVCYRNAVLIMLLTSDVFMKYVREWHASRVENIRQFAQTIENEPKFEHTDVFIKLDELWEVYDANVTEAKLERAMKKYWQYLGSPEVGDLPWQAKGQQDTHDFLMWILGTFRSQLGQNPYLASEADYLNQLIQVGHANRKLCTKCGGKDPKKYRLSVDACEDRLLVHLSNPASTGPANSVGGQSPVKLTDLLEYSTRPTSIGWLCDECYAEWRTAYTQIIDSKEKIAAENAKESKPGRGWAHLRVLPEIIFMVLLRFKSSGSSSSKDETLVEITEELDFAPILEKTMPEEERVNTRYRLQSVVSHQGSLSHGHYRNHVRANDGQDTDWWLIDGTSTEAVDFGHINKEDRPNIKRNQPGKPWTPYMLCWQRIIEDPTPSTGTPIQQPVSPTTGFQRSVSSGGKHRSSSDSAKDQRTVHFDEALAEPQEVVPEQPEAKPEELRSGAVQEEQKSKDSSTKSTPVDRQSPDPPTLNSKIRAFVEIDGKRHVFHEIMLELPSDFVDKVRQKKGAKVELGVQLHIPQEKGKHTVVYDLVTASNPPESRKVGILDNDDCLSGRKHVLIETRSTTPTDSLQKNNQTDLLDPLATQETSPGRKRKLNDIDREASDEVQSEAPSQKKAKQGLGAKRGSSASRSASPVDAISNQDRIKALAHSDEALETETPEGLEALKLRLQLEDRQSTFNTLATPTQAAATPRSAKARAKFDKNGKPRASTISPTFQPDPDLTAIFLRTLLRSKASHTGSPKAKTAEPASFNTTAAEDISKPSTKRSTDRRRSSLPPNLRMPEPSPVLKRTRGQTARAQEEKQQQQQAASKVASAKSQQGHDATATGSQPASKPQAVPPTKMSSGSDAQKDARDSKKTPPVPAAPPSPRKSSSPYEEEWSPGKEARIAAAAKAKRIADKRAARRKQVEKEEAEAEEEGEQAKPKLRGRAAAKARVKADVGKGKAAAKSTAKPATKATTTTKSTTITKATTTAKSTQTKKPVAKQATKRKRDDDSESESEEEDVQPVKKARTKATKATTKPTTKVTSTSTSTAKPKPNPKARTTTTTTTTTTTKQQPKNQKTQAKPTKQQQDQDDNESSSSSSSTSDSAPEDADGDYDDHDDKGKRTKVQPSTRAARGRSTQRKKPSKAHVARFFL